MKNKKSTKDSSISQDILTHVQNLKEVCYLNILKCVMGTIAVCFLFEAEIFISRVRASCQRP